MDSVLQMLTGALGKAVTDPASLEPADVQVVGVVLLVVLGVVVGVTFLAGGKTVTVEVAKGSDIPRGEMREVAVKRPGQKGKETIVLARTHDDKLHAIGSKCTHYKLSLLKGGKGVLSGDRVVCPYHAAGFNVRSGDMEDGPALDSLPTFPVREDGGRVLVQLPSDAKQKLPSRCSRQYCTAAPASQEHFLVVGAGAAGAAAVEELRARGFDGRITLVNAERVLPYDRTKLSKAISSNAKKQAFRDAAFYEQLQVGLVTGARVVDLDLSARRAQLDSGEAIKYDQVLCCTGGRARMFAPGDGIEIPGAHLRHIFGLRQEPDNSDMVRRVTDLEADGQAAHVVIVGSSFIGMEAAAALTDMFDDGALASVTVVGMESEPFERVLGTQIGRTMRAVHERKGVRFQMKSRVLRFVPRSEAGGAVAAAAAGGAGDEVGAVVVQDESGEHTLPAHLVVVGAGIVPAVDYLDSEGNREAGVELLKHRMGNCVQSDASLSIGPNAFAAGDIVQFPFAYATCKRNERVRIEHWDVAMDQGRTAARNMMAANSGADLEEFDAVPFFWTGQFGYNIRYAGNAMKVDEVIVQGTEASRGRKACFTAFIVTHDDRADNEGVAQISAVATVNDDPQATSAMELMRLRQMPSVEDVRAASKFDLSDWLRDVQQQG